ncbi:MAG TPA: FKBP-type peptidyl-prolyl cis-trans isomerase [Candidatus Thermoplasmatota archaeon]|nr:FKBP-type peptidyl-prolyl cis-trans isomerase [Candidatus Thermoplasmatota archaeon]
MRATWPLAAVLLLLAGCLGAPSSPVRVVPYVELNDAEPGRATEFALFLRSTSAFKETFPVASVERDGWNVTPEAGEVTIPGGATTSLVVRVTPGQDVPHGVHEVTVKVGETAARLLVNVRALGDVTLAPGMGASVYYVLWLDNGTLFATNLKAAADRADVARMPQDEPPTEAAWRPLKVYVGGQRGQPPPEPYNSEGCDEGEAPPCFHPVIPGFDQRLRGMVAGETLAVRVPKEQAYTVPGNETHPLYGHNLNFLVRVVDVHQYAVRACSLPVCPPVG